MFVVPFFLLLICGLCGHCTIVWLVLPIVSEQRPNDPCRFVGQCYGRNIFVSTNRHGKSPITGVKLLHSTIEHGPCPVNQQGAQIRVPALADSKEVLLASARVLTGNQTEPGSQFAATTEVGDIANRRDYRRCGEIAQAWNLLQTLA